jgi:hypothetical protein
MRVVLRDPSESAPHTILGKYGKESWASQSPADPDLYLQEVWATDEGACNPSGTPVSVEHLGRA